ncbi:MAG: hypothetical protein ACYDBJ_08350 [Aggregatilineales bacterium]
MNVEELLKELDELPPEDWERIKAHIIEREQATHPRTLEEWQGVVDSAVDAFWGDSMPEEMETPAAAMSLK